MVSCSNVRVRGSGFMVYSVLSVRAKRFRKRTVQGLGFRGLEPRFWAWFCEMGFCFTILGFEGLLFYTATTP